MRRRIYIGSLRYADTYGLTEEIHSDTRSMKAAEYGYTDSALTV